MNISNNLDSMVASQIQVNKLASNLADVANTIGDPEFQDVTQDLINSIVEQVPEVISYEANAQGIKTNDAVNDTLLNIRA